MVITEIKEAGKGKHMVIREDGLFLTLYYREMKGLGFKEGEEPGEEQWAIGVKSVITRGKKRIFHLLAKKDYTEHEIVTKLTRENYHQGHIEVIMAYFKELGYIDDRRYVSKYYNWHKESRSKRVIEQKLKVKGIDRSLMREVIEEEAKEEDAYLAARRHADKKYGRKEVSREDYPKMIQFLMRKGFDYGLCKKVIDEIIHGDEDQWNQ